MKVIHSIILIIVVALGIIIGTNMKQNDFPLQIETNQNQSLEPTVSKEEQKEQVQKFYDYVKEILLIFDKIDSNFIDIEQTNISKVQLYDYFNELIDLMEEGQLSPLGKAIPNSLNSTQKKEFQIIADELDNAFTYRKFAYQKFVKYMETNNITTLSEGRLWLNDGKSSQMGVVVYLANIGVQYDLQTDIPKE